MIQLHSGLAGAAFAFVVICYNDGKWMATVINILSMVTNALIVAYHLRKERQR